MSIRAQSVDGNENEFSSFLSTLKQAALLLDTFGQIQAVVGSLTMSHKAGVTFEVHASLENYINQIEYNQNRAK